MSWAIKLMKLSGNIWDGNEQRRNCKKHSGQFPSSEKRANASCINFSNMWYGSSFGQAIHSNVCKVLAFTITLHWYSSLCGQLWWTWPQELVSEFCQDLSKETPFLVTSTLISDDNLTTNDTFSQNIFTNADVLICNKSLD